MIDAKVYVMLLLRRLRVDMEERLHDAQHGSGRGTADCLFNLRQVVELARAHATPMHAAFVPSARPLTRSTTRPCGRCWKHEASTPS